jgi:hypothetical protein
MYQVWRVLFLFLVVVASVRGADDVWLVGGGYDVRNSEAEIEQNVLWIRRILQGQVPSARLHIYFTDGDDPWPDVKVWRPAPDSTASMQPLARVFDTYYLNGESFRNHQVPDVEGKSTADVVSRGLSRDISQLRAGDDGLLIYLGHGSEGEVKQGGNRLDLWGNSELTASDLQALFAAAEPGVRLRFVLTQCYAGGFYRLVEASSAAGSGNTRGERCGFMAVPADEPAEGCTAAMDNGDYRGYSTYFFAALQGRNRDGSPLLVVPDRNGDGRVTLLEAHLYALRAARSTDLPLATSEQFLLRWSPWYLPLLRVNNESDNAYRQIAGQLADDLEQEDVSVSGASARRSYRKQLERDMHRLDVEQQRLQASIADARSRIRALIEMRWPETLVAHTQAYREFLQHKLGSVQAFILSHPDYAQLKSDQDAYWVLDGQILEQERRLRQVDRLEHLQALARLRDGLRQYGSETARAAYEQLRHCEDQPL